MGFLTKWLELFGISSSIFRKTHILSNNLNNSSQMVILLKISQKSLIFEGYCRFTWVFLRKYMIVFKISITGVFFVVCLSNILRVIMLKASQKFLTFPYLLEKQKESPKKLQFFKIWCRCQTCSRGRPNFAFT